MMQVSGHTFSDEISRVNTYSCSVGDDVFDISRSVDRLGIVCTLFGQYSKPWNHQRE